jgi:predicted metal-dependent hydrolase
MSATKQMPHTRPGRGDEHYAGFFDCFNRQRYFEAHEALEPFWLERRGLPGAQFDKDLIQVAGAFVHLQKNRLEPAARLFRLAVKNLRPFAPQHEGLNVARLLRLVDECLTELQGRGTPRNPYDAAHPPTLKLETT